MWGISIAHQRSKQKQKERMDRRKIRYTLKTLINHTAFRDPIRAETVSLISHSELEHVGFSMFGEEYYRHEEFLGAPWFCEVDKGTVLSDSRGNGVLQ